MKTISEIKRELEEAEVSVLEEVIAQYLGDDRTGVRKLITAAKKRQEAYLAEKQRIYALQQYERE